MSDSEILRHHDSRAYMQKTFCSPNTKFTGKLAFVVAASSESSVKSFHFPIKFCTKHIPCMVFQAMTKN